MIWYCYVQHLNWQILIDTMVKSFSTGCIRSNNSFLWKPGPKVGDFLHHICPLLWSNTAQWKQHTNNPIPLDRASDCLRCPRQLYLLLLKTIYVQIRGRNAKGGDEWYVWIAWSPGLVSLKCHTHHWSLLIRLPRLSSFPQLTSIRGLSCELAHGVSCQHKVLTR